MVSEIQTWEAFDHPPAGNSCKQQIVTTFALNINLVIKEFCLLPCWTIIVLITDVGNRLLINYF